MARALTGPAAWPHEVRWIDAQRGRAATRLTADAATRVRVAAVFDVESVRDLTAEYLIRPLMDGVELSGRVKAVAARLCGVTLETYDEAVDEPFSIKIVRADSPNAPTAAPADASIDLSGDDPPDVLASDTIDVGAYLVEQFALGLAPFARKPGAVFKAPPAEQLSPFAVLRQTNLGDKA